MQSRILFNKEYVKEAFHLDSITRVEYRNTIYHFATDLRPILPWIEVPTMSKDNLFGIDKIYSEYVDNIDIECQTRSRVGCFGDSGWDMCLAGTYKPHFNDCLIYSIG
ncbi:hypothetical protein LSH36_643g01061 [Paralvinella palmiformis]|uniref:Uncharacterized protein n=1 Tax=Paralvinella palmiformis TaxID=53620 RepID=A0AAD9MWV0_9ANNE|nr:hypothetical protein LSH36_643g01061 [Paralvinella palmiformis]